MSGFAEIGEIEHDFRYDRFQIWQKFIEFQQGYVYHGSCLANGLAN